MRWRSLSGYYYRMLASVRLPLWVKSPQLARLSGCSSAAGDRLIDPVSDHHFDHSVFFPDLDFFDLSNPGNLFDPCPCPCPSSYCLTALSKSCFR